MNTRRRLLISNNIDVCSLVFSYTDTFDDEIVTIGGKEYRLLTFVKNGTLTLDRRMLGRIPFDMWVVGGGGASGSGEDYGWHSVCSSYPNSGFAELSGGWHGCDIGCDIQYGTLKYGESGGNGGWEQKNAYKASSQSLVVDTGAGDNSISESGAALISTLAGGNGTTDTSGTNRARNGTAWFTLPANNSGNGATGGHTSQGTGCATHGKYPSTPSSSPGTPGIAYIRIPLKY